MPASDSRSADPIDSPNTNVLTTAGRIDPTATYTELRLPDGRSVRMLTAGLLQLRTDDESPDSELSLDHSPEPGVVRVPIVEETLRVGRRTLETGKVRLRKSVHDFETELNEVLAYRTFDIERIVLNQPIESAPSVRQEGDTTVYPIVEEQLILTRQLVLKEELRVTRRDAERLDNRTVTLRRESIEIERETPGEV